MNETDKTVLDTDKELDNELDQEGSLWGNEEEEAYESTNRKIGIARFFELLGRDFGSIYLAGLFFLIAVLPGVAVIYFSIMAEVFPGAVLGGILAGLAGAPMFCGLVDTILRSLRDEANLWWSRYRKAWKQNWKQSLIPGGIAGCFGGIWSWIMLHLPDMENVPTSVCLNFLNN